MKKTILYVCVTPIYAVGEIENAVRFAMGLRKEGYSSHFLAFPLGAHLIKQHGLSVDELGLRKKDNHRIFTDACKRIKPDWILIADGFLFDFWFGPKHIFDLKWILDNPTGARFATFDNLCLSLKNRILPLYNNAGLEDKFRWLHTTGLTGIMPVLVPCPHAFPTGEQTNVFYYRRHIEELKWDKSQKEGLKKSIGLSAGEKLVLFSMTGWALEAAWLVTEDLDAWLRHFSLMIEAIFQEVQEKTTLLVISAYPFLVSSTKGSLRIVNWESLPINTYRKVLVSSDLFITTNAVSNSIILAVMSKVPAASLFSSGNDFRTNRTIPPQLLSWFKIAEGKYPDLLKPYLVFPVGWREIVTPLFENNPYRNTFELLDLLDPAGTTDTINGLLFDSKRKISLLERQENHKSEIAHLPGPGEVMRNLTENT